MIRVAYVELPSEGRYKVKIDDQDTGLFVSRRPGTEMYEVQDEEGALATRKGARSREGASLLAAYIHYERERKALTSV
jgi:hypothetical protein